MQSGIYKITHKDRILYVGCSNNIKKRKWQHFNRLRAGKHHNFIVQRFFNSHPKELLFDTLEFCEVDSLAEKEQFYIDTLEPIANISGSVGSHQHTEEAKKKMRGRIVSSETREKLSQAHKGKPSPRKGIPTNYVPTSAFKKGSIPWNKGKKLKPSWNNGKKLSESHKKALTMAKRTNKSFIGKVFKLWTIKDFATSRNGSRVWLCLCRCGQEHEIRSQHLKNGSSVGCRKCTRALRKGGLGE